MEKNKYEIKEQIWWTAVNEAGMVLPYTFAPSKGLAKMKMRDVLETFGMYEKKKDEFEYKQIKTIPLDS